MTWITKSFFFAVVFLKFVCKSDKLVYPHFDQVHRDSLDTPPSIHPPARFHPLPREIFSSNATRHALPHITRWSHARHLTNRCCSDCSSLLYS